MKSRAFVALVVLLSAGCEQKSGGLDELVSAAQEESAPAPPPPPAPKRWETMPTMTVDELGAYIGGERADLSKKDGEAKLQDIVSRLPIDKKAVTLQASKNARTQDVAKVVWELGKAGAPSVIIKTDGRSDLASEIVVVPESRIGGKIPECSVAVTVTDELDTGVWQIKGGIGNKHRPGFAGPDVSNTEESVKKKLKICDSRFAFFSGSFKHKWLHAFSMGAVIKRADSDKKIENLVLLTDEPVAGRKVELKK